MQNINFPSIKTKEGAYHFLLALIFSQNVKAEKSWEAPLLLFQRLQTNNPDVIVQIPLEEMVEVFLDKPILHPFVRTMAYRVIEASRHLMCEYGGDSRLIWTPSVEAKTVISRLISFPGIGEHKAIVGLFLLTREYEVLVWDDGFRVDLMDKCENLAILYAPFTHPKLITRT